MSTRFPETTLDAGRVRELAERDLDDLQALLERCADFFELQGEPLPTATAARDEWVSVPDGTPLDHKHVVGLYAPDLAGIVELVRDWPRAGTWNIGLLLLEPAARRRRAGTQLVAAVDAWAAGAGAATLRISVVPANEPAMAFWRGLGFRPVPAVGAHPTAIALERPVARHP